MLVVENLLQQEDVWWLRYVPQEPAACKLDVVKIPDASLTRAFVPLLRAYATLHRYDMVVTQQDGYASLIFAFLNSLLRRRPSMHVINEFMTRERTADLYSNLKYRLLRFSLGSTHRILCSSRGEIAYYRKSLRLPECRFAFVPLATDPRFTSIPTESASDYILSAGRTGRDYATLLRAIEGLPVRLLIIADRQNLDGLSMPRNVEALFNIPLSRLMALMAAARFVVLPLQDRTISIGQSVLLQAMALGKATIVTQIAATVDYVQDGKSGLFVRPRDSAGLRAAITRLLDEPGTAESIGAMAREIVRREYLPEKKIRRISEILSGKGDARNAGSG